MDLYEYWKPVFGFEGAYEVSTHGRVRSVPRPRRQWHGALATVPARILSQDIGSRGHRRVALYLKGQKTRHLVHRLVLAAFVGPCPPGMEGCHGDGDPSNNHLTNLRWDTKPANAADSISHGTHPSARKTHCPRNHPLTAENNTVSQARIGRRTCLACSREQTSARNQNRPFDPIRADERYAQIARKAS